MTQPQHTEQGSCPEAGFQTVPSGPIPSNLSGSKGNYGRSPNA